MNKNIVSWFEIYVTDMSRAKKFYEAVFNTQLEKLETEGMEYLMFPYQEGGKGLAAHWLKWLACQLERAAPWFICHVRIAP